MEKRLIFFIFFFVTFGVNADIRFTEEQIDRYIYCFDSASLIQVMDDYQQQQENAGMRLTAQDYYLLAKACEGLLSCYEVNDDAKSIRKTALLGVELATSGLKLDSTHSDLHRLLSRFYAKLIDWSNGMDLGPKLMGEIDLALKYDPQNPKAILARIAVYLYSPSLFGGNVDLALKKLQDFTILYPNLEDGFINLGIACKIKGDSAGARQIFAAIIEKNPGNLTAKKELKLIDMSNYRPDPFNRN